MMALKTRYRQGEENVMEINEETSSITERKMEHNIFMVHEMEQ